MKVLHESHRELKLKRPLDLKTTLLMSLFGGWFTVMPIFMAVMFLQELGVTRLSCSRPEPTQVTCQHQQSGLFGLQKQSDITYANVTGASLQTLQGKDEEGQTTYEHQVTLATEQGEKAILEAPMMVNGVKGDPVEMGAIAQQISQFIESEQPSFHFEQDNRQQASSLAPLAFLLLFPTVGIGAMYFTLQSEELLFDREQGLLLRQRKTLFGSKHQQVALNDIETTEIKAQGRKPTYHQLNLLPKSLKTRPLMRSQRWSEVAEMEAKVQQFLTRSQP